MMLNIYNPYAMSLQSINFLHLMVSEVLPRQNFVSRSLQLDQRSNRGHTMTLHT